LSGYATLLFQPAQAHSVTYCFISLVQSTMSFIRTYIGLQQKHIVFRKYFHKILLRGILKIQNKQYFENTFENSFPEYFWEINTLYLYSSKL